MKWVKVKLSIWIYISLKKNISIHLDSLKKPLDLFIFITRKQFTHRLLREEYEKKLFSIKKIVNLNVRKFHLVRFTVAGGLKQW